MVQRSDNGLIRENIKWRRDENFDFEITLTTESEEDILLARLIWGPNR